MRHAPFLMFWSVRPAALGVALCLLTLCASLLTAGTLDAQPAVKLGVDVLAESDFEALRGKRVGLIAHPASVAGDLTHSVDVLRRGADAGHFEFVAIFGPEHGVYGDVYAGDKIASNRDARTGLPTRSLYGKTRKPTAKMLDDIDVLVFDLQDIGSRSYTFISTMRLCLEASIEQDKTFIILDRPNPLGGQRVEGPAEIKDGFRSFISQIDVPYVHGMTMGELAKLERDRIDKTYDKLIVIEMQGWSRGMSWGDTGLTWVPTSPHIPTAGAAAGYAGTGVLGELGIVSNGVGYTLPFEIVGAPGVDADELCDKLRSLDLDGIHFRAARFKPFFATYKGEACGGVQIHFDPDAEANYYQLNFILMREMGLLRTLRTKRSFNMFDKANGTDDTRKWLAKGKPLEELFARWDQSTDRFRVTRQPYLIYE